MNLSWKKLVNKKQILEHDQWVYTNNFVEFLHVYDRYRKLESLAYYL